ncbi:sensor histidine kinase [Chryseobacterium sp. T1]
MFLILVGIQVYFLYKTYKIKESQAYDYVIGQLDYYRDDFKKEYGLREDTVQSYFVKFREGKINESQFRENIKHLNKKSIPSYTLLIDSIFSKDHYEVATRYDLLSTKYLPEDRLLFTKPITIFETSRKVTKPGKTQDGTWETSSSTTDDDKNDSATPRLNSYKTKTANYYEIKNIQSIVFKDLWILIICCILILAAVLWIFILTIKNLIRQQKQVEVLHTVVDNIAHEFKTPIATLKIATKALKKDWNKNNLPLLERQINRLESLMHQLHNDDDTTIEVRNIVFSDWNYFIEDLKFSHPEIEFNFENHTPEQLPFNKTDMETLIKNLSENSIKYGATQVKIQVKIIKNQLEISITDNGIGIAKKELNNIFEKFYRVQSDNIHNTKGLGLGLFIVKSIIEKYNGKIELTSEVNIGTTFKLTLPYEN